MIPAGEPPTPPTLVHSLAHQAATRPNAHAFVFLERGERISDIMTFAELDQRARMIAGALHARDLAGRTVVLAYPPGLEIIAALFGCFYAGAIAVVASIAHYGNAVERLRVILTDSRAACMLSTQAHAELPLENAGGAETPILCTDTLQPPSQTFSCAIPHPETICLLQYTSGSTGNPRAVMLTHANLMSNQRIIADILGSTPDKTGVSWLPLYHDMGLIGAVLQAVYAGPRLVLMSPLAFLQRPVVWLRAIATYRAAISVAPAFAYALCNEHVRESDLAALDLSSWRSAICGGETIPPHTLEKFAARFAAAGFNRTAFIPAYGLAESTLLATSTPPGTGLITHPGSPPADAPPTTTRQRVCCGHPWHDQEIAIADPHTRTRTAPGAAGEIWLRGPSVAAGYWQRPVETHATFGATLEGEPNGHPWLRTGDLGYLCPDGLVVTGRLKDMLVIRGANLDPADLEAAASHADPCLEGQAAAAFTIDTDEAEVVVVAHEVSRACLRDIDVHAITAKVTAALSRAFGLVLHDLVLLRAGALPRTTSGKVQRHACRDAYQAGLPHRLAAIHHPSLGRCRPSRP